MVHTAMVDIWITQSTCGRFLSHQVTDPPDHLGVVDLQPGHVEAEVGVGHVHGADAEDEHHPAGRDGSEDVTAVKRSSCDGVCTRTPSHAGEVTGLTIGPTSTCCTS